MILSGLCGLDSLHIVMNPILVVDPVCYCAAPTKDSIRQVTIEEDLVFVERIEGLGRHTGLTKV